MLSFKEYLVEALRTGTFWHNAASNKLVEVRGSDGSHANAVRNRPEEFDLKQSDIAKIDAGRRAVDIVKLMKTNRWSRVVVGPAEWNIETKNLRFAWKTAVALDKKFPRPESRIVIATDSKDEFLEGSQIRTFIKTGRVIKQTEIGATMARFR